MRRTWIWMALLVSIGAGASIAWFTGHQAPGPPADAVKPTEGSLLRASGMPLVTASVAVPGGYEAAAWDNTGRITFWKWANASRTWAKAGASTYPVLPQSVGTPSAKIVGALLSGMTDATFIASGLFTGDGTGNFIAFTNGPRGWGTVAPGPSGTLIPTGNRSTDNRTPGNSYTELFHGGDLEISEPGNLPFGPNGEEWQVERLYAWSSGAFRKISTTQFTAALALPLPATAPPYPAASCQAVRPGTYRAQAVSASTRFTSGKSLSRAYLPTSVVLQLQGDASAAGCDFVVAPDFPVVISAGTISGNVWITAPAWVLTSGANGDQDIRDLLSGTQLPGQDELGASEFQDPGFSPYYVPKSLDIDQLGPLGTPIVRIRSGRLAALTLLPS
jgi:hypothetical protein